ncbi:26S proteasome non-ATPase regulatory subunit like [Actinidia chinensis var. chinensis]|uniref:26S proteasome non-ATPase regulatory subunit like n=1 Tax=Actinidia chinensis var. chinensis TaxID=1590841 RepID=A0A2R6QS59_ACTCC|nr:26S proteasome non-ATPase regulatory subunit like [Actinidia chinensis var. chinensis]
MVATNLKAETMSLMDKRSTVEAQMDAIIERLSQPGGPGLSGNLLDSEGFPRADIDIPAVRADRHRLAELRNDHKDITERINQNIQLLHSAMLAPKSSPNSGNIEGSNNQDSSAVNVGTSASSLNVLSGNTISAMDVDVTVSIPFALVDEIAEDSPAAADGLQLGDQVVKFGNVESGDNLLPKLASEAQTNQGLGIPVVVLRQGTLITLTVTPRVWQGRGLLGCHFRIL